MQRNQRTTVSALVAAVLVLAFLYPCSPGTAQPAASAHDCCAPAAGIRAAETECCADLGAAASKATTIAVPAPTVLERIPVAVLAAPIVPRAAQGLGHPREAAPSPPLVLRV